MNLAVLTLATVVLSGSPSAERLLEATPARASVVAVVDHGVLGAHPAYLDMLRFLYRRGLARGVASLREAGIDLVAQKSLSVGYGLADGRTAEIVPLSAAQLDQVKGHLAKIHKAPPQEGTTGALPWVRWSDRLTVGLLPDGRGILGSHGLVQKAQTEAAGRGAGKGSTRLRAVLKFTGKARKAGAGVWGMGWDPRKGEIKAGAPRLERLSFQAVGDKTMNVRVVAATESLEASKELARRARDVIQRKLVKPMMMRATGVSRLASSVQVTTRDKEVVSTVALDVGQVQLLARMGPEILAALGVR